MGLALKGFFVQHSEHAECWNGRQVKTSKPCEEEEASEKQTHPGESRKGSPEPELIVPATVLTNPSGSRALLDRNQRKQRLQVPLH